MPNGRDTDPVTYGRWQEAHQALTERVTDLETEVRETNWRALVADVENRLRAVETAVAGMAGADQAAATRRRDRQWALMIAFLTGLILPLLILAVVALTSAHLH